MSISISLDVKNLSEDVIFPQSRNIKEGPKTAPVSVLDAKCLRFSPAGALWFFEAPPGPTFGHLSTAEHLKAALSQTLSHFPQWTGTLSLAQSRVGWQEKALTDHTHRFGRVFATYNAPTDAGVRFTEASSSQTLSLALGSLSVKHLNLDNSSKIVDATSFPRSQLLPDRSKLTFHSQAGPDASGVVIKLTQFSCGGFALAVLITHVLADAQSLMLFMKAWAEKSRNFGLAEQGGELTEQVPQFDPQLLDSYASKEIDEPHPSPDVMARSRKLPMRFFDWYNHSGQPSPWGEVSVPSELEEFYAGASRSAGEPMPWDRLDMSKKSKHLLLRFSGVDVEGIYASALKAATADAGNDEQSQLQIRRISRHDALLAHVWAAVNRARAELSPEGITLHLSVGIRQRLSPALPETFLGSPIIHCELAPPAPASPAPSSSSSTALISQIRTSLAKFTSSTLPPLLHDFAHEPSAQRFWHAFMGRADVIVTPWIRLGIYDLDFGAHVGGLIEYVEPVMTLLDGIMVLWERKAEQLELEGEEKKRHWSDGGVDVALYLDEDTVRVLKNDQGLWSW